MYTEGESRLYVSQLHGVVKGAEIETVVRTQFTEFNLPANHWHIQVSTLRKKFQHKIATEAALPQEARLKPSLSWEGKEFDANDRIEVDCHVEDEVDDSRCADLDIHQRKVNRLPHA